MPKKAIEFLIALFEKYGLNFCQRLTANEPFERGNPQVSHCRQALQNACYIVITSELYKMLAMLSLRASFAKMLCCHCEPMKSAWQSINLNANLPLDCHEFARLRFANSRNDKTASHTDKFVILTCLVILSVSEVSINLKCFEFCGFFCYGLRLATHLVAMLKMTFFIITSKLNALRGKSQRLFLP